MTKTYAQVARQIEVLQAEAEKLRRKETDGVITRIKDAIRIYGLTPADLGFAGKAATRRKYGTKKPGRKPRKGAAKFRDTATGNVWGGRGPRPRWLREALAGGKSLQEFAV